MAECKVSVCIPTYNYAAFLPEAIESILTQRFTDFELIIIDDNSTDDTRAVIQRYLEQDSRIRFSVNSVNLGMVENWNLCLAEARGEYIKFIFGDDLLDSPDTLGRMTALLDAHSSVSLVCSARHLIDENSRQLRVESHFETGIMPGTDIINQVLTMKCNVIGEPSVTMFRKAQASRGFAVKYRQIVDLEMWFHLLEQGSFAFINEPLCSFRIHDRQQTEVNKKGLSNLREDISIMHDYLVKDYIKLSRFQKRYLLYDNAYGIWRLYKKRKQLTRAEACELIDANFGYQKFLFWFPFYKIYKPFLKLYRRLSAYCFSPH